MANPDARPQDPTDTLLVNVARAGDEGAFAQIVGRHQAFVRRIAAAILRSDAAAEDIAQEVFVRLWHHLETIDPGGSLRGWLGKVASNLAIDELRRQRRRTVVLRLLGVVSAQDPEERAMSLLDSARLRDAIARLPRRDAQVVILHYLADMSYQDVASSLGLTPTAVRIRAFRALKRLQVSL